MPSEEGNQASLHDGKMSLHDALTVLAPPKLYSIFDQRQKIIIVFLISFAATFSGFASNIYFPAIPMIAHELKVTVDLVNLTVTSYLVFQAIAPSLWGPISDVKGRRVAYCGTFLIFLAACIGLALAKNYESLVILRCLQSAGSASTIAIGSGVIGDITTQEERGSFMGFFQTGMLAPVALGPVIGGLLSGSLGWESVFWFLAIYSGAYLVLLVLFLPETLRSIVGNGSKNPTSVFTRFPLSLYQKTTNLEWLEERNSEHEAPKKSVNITAPIRILVTKHAFPIILFLAVHYAVWQMSLTAMSSLFEKQYHLSETEIGLCFMPNGVGSIIGTILTGKLLDFDYRRIKARCVATTDLPDVEEAHGSFHVMQLSDDDFPLEEARLRRLPYLTVMQCLSIMLFGWATQYPDHVHIAVPIVATFITGWAVVATQGVVMTYLVDIFPDDSGAASASLNLARCLLAAGGTSCVMPMIHGVGIGVAFSICASIQVISGLGLVLQWKFAGKWRKEASMATA